MGRGTRGKREAIMRDYFADFNKPLPPETWKGIPHNIKDYKGFVYLITNKINGMKYIGQKKFWDNKTLPPLKGKSHKRHIVVESNWKDYFGSNKELKLDVAANGKENFSRQVLHLCKSKAMMNYLETEEQFKRKVLFKKHYYNNYIGCRINGNTVKKVKQ